MAPNMATAQYSQSEQEEIGRTLGRLFNILSDPSQYKESEAPSLSAACPKGTEPLTEDPLICIGKRPPTLPNNPKYFEFKVCTQLRGTFICLPGYFDCEEEKEERTCEISITTPPLIPSVKCEINRDPDGGTAIHCSYPSEDNPFKRTEETIRFTYPTPGKICLFSPNENEKVCFSDSLFPTLKPLIEKLPGYPTGTPDTKPSGHQSNWE
jgi:hypothetical protein